MKDQEGNRNKRRAKMLKKWTRVVDNERCFNLDITDDEGNLLLEREADPAEHDATLQALDDSVKGNRIAGYATLLCSD